MPTASRSRLHRKYFWLNVLVLIVGLCSGAFTAAARTRKGDKLHAQGKAAELRKNWDEALDLYEKALAEDPSDTAYRMSVTRIRFQAAQAHVDHAQNVRADGKLEEALEEFQKAYAMDPASSIAEQEIRRTKAMIEREKKRSDAAKPSDATPEEKGLTPAQFAKRQAEEKLSTLLPVPELKPLNPQPINLKMNNQPAKVLYETVGKLAGVNVLFDPEYNTQVRNQSVEFNNSTLEEALDYLGMVTKSFWKALSPNTIFVTNDNTTKRRDYEEQVMRVVYLSNITTAQELQEVVTAVRSVADIQRIFTYNAQNAIIMRAEADRIALAEKIIADLDKPKPEVVVDVVVMSMNKVKSRDLQAGITSINQPVVYNPRLNRRVGSSTTTTTTPSSNGSTTGSTTNTGTTSTTTTAGNSTLVGLNSLGLATSDYAVTLPNGLLQAMMQDRNTRVLQSPQVRAADNQKATLKIGDKVPTASGSFQPGIGGVGVGVSPLVNTQFQFLDVGVNVDIVPHVHSPEEVSLHVEVEISSVRDRIDIGGIQQPVIGQSKVIFDVRTRDGETNLLGGLMQLQETKTINGVPVLSSIPVIKRFFSSEGIEKSESELMIALVPHIVRTPEISEQNLRSIAVGNATVVKLNYAPHKPEPSAAAPAAGPAAVTPAATTPAATPLTPPVTAPAPATPPVTAPATAVPIPGVPPTAPPVTPPATAPATPAPTGPVQVNFAPPSIAAQLSEGFVVTLMVQNAADLAAAPMQIRFDPKFLRLDQVALGTLLGGDGKQVLFTKNILNDAGEATVDLKRLPNTGGVNGSGTLVTLTFQAVGRGATLVGIPNVTLRNSQGQTIGSASPQLTVNVR